MNEKIYEYTCQITQEEIKKFSQATCNQADIYAEDSSAKKYGFKAIPAPPTLGTILEIDAIPDFGLVVSDFGLDPLKVLQYEQEYYYNDLIFAGDEITCQVKTKRIRNILIFESAFIHNQKGILISGKSKYIQPNPKEKKMEANNINKKSGENLGIVRNFMISKDHIDNYAKTSRDYNPIHIHDSEEIRKEYGGVLAHGMLLMGIASNVIPPESLKRLRHYKARFLSPAKPGERLVVLSNLINSMHEPDRESFSGDIVIQNDEGEDKMAAEVLVSNENRRK